MRSAFCSFVGRVAFGRGGADVARFALLAQVGKSTDRQLVSPAELPPKVTPLANGTVPISFIVVKSCRLIALSVGFGVENTSHPEIRKPW